MKTILEDIKQFKLKKWIESEEIRDKLVKAVDVGEVDEISIQIFEYAGLVEKLEEKVPWFEIAALFSDIFSKNIPKVIPFLLGQAKNETVPWDYAGHPWYFWAHTFAKAYSYSLEYIAEMNIDDALALMQEIETDNQLKMEWEWSMTEIAYPYNPTTQKSEFKPLTRPDWMKIKIESDMSDKTKSVRLPMSMLPVGNVIRYGNTNPS